MNLSQTIKEALSAPLEDVEITLNALIEARFTVELKEKKKSVPLLNRRPLDSLDTFE
jgi:hypothetical protein